MGGVLRVVVPPTPGASSDNVLQDATMQLEWPFSEWWRHGLASPSIVLGACLLVGSLAAAWVLRRSLPEISLWLLADLLVLVTADAGIVDRPFNSALSCPGRPCHRPRRRRGAPARATDRKAIR